jgi:hypothetical protein
MYVASCACNLVFNDALRVDVQNTQYAESIHSHDSIYNCTETENDHQIVQLRSFLGKELR